MTPEGELQSGSTEAEPITQVNAADESAVTPERTPKRPTEAEPITQVNGADEVEDVMRVTPEGCFQNEPTGAIPQQSILGKRRGKSLQR